MLVDLLVVTDQSITYRIRLDPATFYFNAIYACNKGVERRRLWNHLISLKSSLSDEPWTLAGDFNIIAHHSESCTAALMVNSDNKEFTEAMHRLFVFDHVFSGPIFTWSNRQQDSFISRKLDRVLINDAWLLRFAHSYVEFLPPKVFDHRPTYIQLQ